MLLSFFLVLGVVQGGRRKRAAVDAGLGNAAASL